MLRGVQPGSDLKIGTGQRQETMADAPRSAQRGVPRTLALELARVTERAAIAAARLRGKGDEKAAQSVREALETKRSWLAQISSSME